MDWFTSHFKSGKDLTTACVDSAPDKKPKELFPDNFCTVEITYLQEKHSQSKREANVHSLVGMESSLNWLLGDISIARRFMDAFVQKAQYSTMYYAKVFFIILVLGCALDVLIKDVMMCACILFLTLLITRIAHFTFLSHFSFHYFLYHALTKKQVWAPRQLPQLHPSIKLI